jgi:PAS domain S-box-containing protein
MGLTGAPPNQNRLVPVVSISPQADEIALHRALSARRQLLLDQIGPLSPSMFYVYDLTSMRTRYIHRELAEMLGFSPAGADFSEISRLVHPEDQELLTRHIGQMKELADHQVADEVFRVRSPAGEYLWIHSRCRVLRRGRNGAARLIVGAASDVTKQRRQAEQLEKAAQALARAEIEERRRVGRELHDSTAQHLLAVDLALGAMERRHAFTPKDEESLRDIRDSLSAARQEIRTLSFVLHPPQLEAKGLPEAMRAFADGFGRRASLAISVEAESGLRLSSDVELALFRIFQEALMNVHRHASATHVTSRVFGDEGYVRLEVEDDGQFGGELTFDPDEEVGVGISGMRARLLQLGGRLSLRRGAAGLRVQAEVPCPATSAMPSLVAAAFWRGQP